MTADAGRRPAPVRARGWGWRHAGRLRFAVRRLDLDVAGGERVLLLGPSGSGKSTLLLGLAGLLADTDSGEEEGELTVDGHPAGERAGRGGGAGLVLQDPESGLVMPQVGDDVAFGLENAAVPAERIWPRVRETLAAVGLRRPLDFPAAALSGGEKQRLAIAGAMAAGPPLLLLDEPTANLDPGGAAAAHDAVARLVADRRTTLVVVEHRVDRWLDLVDRVVVLGERGGLLADGAPAEVFARHAAALEAAGVWTPGAGTAAGAPPAASSAAPAAPAVLRARGLAVRHRGGARAAAPALRHTDLDLGAGRACVVTGPNGAGKSTLALAMGGLLPPLSGAVHAPSQRRPLHRLPAPRLARVVGSVFQEPEHQFVTGRVTSELLLGTSHAQQRVAELLDVLRLSGLADANPFTLSGGEQRRLAVATALVHRPPALVLDEPTYGQDARTWRELVRLLQGLRAEGTALLVLTHDEDLAREVADERRVVEAGALSAPVPV